MDRSVGKQDRMARMAEVDKGGGPQRERRSRRGKLGNAGGYAGGSHDTSKRRGGWTRSLWQPWLGFQGSTEVDGLGNVPRLGMDFSRFATKWG